MTPVLFVTVEGCDGQALYAHGALLLQDARLEVVDVLAALDQVHYTFGTASLSGEWFTRKDAPHVFPDRLTSIPEDAWTSWHGPEPCEYCGAYHEDGSC